MPQLDIDLFDDFLFFAFVSLLFGVGDDESEESLVELQGEVALTNNFSSKKKQYDEQARIVKKFSSSIF